MLARSRLPSFLMAALVHLVLLASPPATAAQAMPVTERELLAEIPMVITASRLRQTEARAPASITVIDRRMIEASTAIDIPDLLRLVPGFQVTYTNGHIFNVMYHGGENSWSHRLQVLVDGRSVYSSMFSIVFWNHLDLDIEDIERIEVIRGPNASAYGSNAFRGAINIITRQPFRVRGGTAKAMAGSQQTRHGMLRYAGGGESFDYRVTAGHRSDDGFDAINDHKDLNMASFRGVYDPTTSDSIDLQMGMTDGGVGAWGMNPVTSPDREIDTRSGHAYLRWRHVFHPRNEVYLQLYYNYINWDDLYQVGPISAFLSDRFGVPVSPEEVELLIGKPDQAFTFSRFHGRATRSDIEWQQTLILGEPLRMVWGVGFREDTMQSTQVFDQPGRLYDRTRRLFANAEWQPDPRWGLNAGLMFEDNDIIGSHLSPRLAANYSFVPNQTLRAVATRAIRSPSIYENYEFNVVRFNDGDIFMGLYVSDTDLEAESINAYELGYRALFYDRTLDLDVKVYHERLDNLIYHTRELVFPDFISTVPGIEQGDQGIFKLDNAGEMDVSGAELQARWRPTRLTLVSLQYAYISIHGTLQNRFEDGVLIELTNDVEDSAPRHTVSMLLNRSLSRNWDASLAYFHLSDTIWLGDGQPTSGYNRWDARLAKNWSIRDVRTRLSLIVQNLSDREYAEFREENLFDRRVYVQLKVRT